MKFRGTLIDILRIKLGIDGAIAYTVSSKFIQVLGGVITLLFVAKYLTKLEQGYYYTFGSILAIQVFFELGFTNIISQYVAHENASLTWLNKTSFSGSQESSSRLSSLLRFTMKWFVVISILLFFALLFIGHIFFGHFGSENFDIHWDIPWLLLSAYTSLALVSSALLAFFEGLGFIKEIAALRLVQQVVQLLLVLCLFSLDFKLMAAPLSALISFSVFPLWILFGSRMKILRFIWSQSGLWQVNYRLEIFPFQWKISVSWVSGYFIFQLFNPVLFATEGPLVAGQMGMTLTVLNSILAFSISWITTKVPIFSRLIAKGAYDELDLLFNRALRQSTVLNAVALSGFYCVILLLRYFQLEIQGVNVSHRFLPNLPMLFMIIPILLNHILGSWATYMRCHKQEPMLIVSIFVAALSLISTLYLGNNFGVFGITFGYMLVTIISFFWTFRIFLYYKAHWHSS